MNKLLTAAPPILLLLSLFASGCGPASTVPASPAAVSASPSAAAQNFPVTMTDQQWQAKLPGPAYNVLRRAATEPPGTSPLNDEKREGEFVCLGCQKTLFKSKDKFDSGTGWPSFVRPADPKSVGTLTDYKVGSPRTEVHCADCGGHLGHVFDDGPMPTGWRYCINGTAISFVPRKAP